MVILIGQQPGHGIRNAMKIRTHDEGIACNTELTSFLHTLQRASHGVDTIKDYLLAEMAIRSWRQMINGVADTYIHTQVIHDILV